VGTVTKAETADGITLWDRNNRQDADMTPKERQSAVNERRISANRGDAAPATSTNSQGRDTTSREIVGYGGVKTKLTERNGPTVTLNADGGRTVAGIYGSATTKADPYKTSTAFVNRGIVPTATPPVNLSQNTPASLTLNNETKSDPFQQTHVATYTPPSAPAKTPPVTATADNRSIAERGGLVGITGEATKTAAKTSLNALSSFDNGSGSALGTRGTIPEQQAGEKRFVQGVKDAAETANAFLRNVDEGVSRTLMGNDWTDKKVADRATKENIPIQQGMDAANLQMRESARLAAEERNRRAAATAAANGRTQPGT